MPALKVSCYVDSQASGKVQDSIPVAAIICWYVFRRYSLHYNQLFLTIKMMPKGENYYKLKEFEIFSTEKIGGGRQS